MSDKQKYRPQPKRRFLFRLLLAVFAVAMIPLVLLSMKLLETKSEDMRQAEQTNIDTIAQSIAGQLDTYMSNVVQMQIKHQTKMTLLDDVLTANVNNEMAGVDLLSNLKSGQIFLQDAGIIRLAEKNTVYLAGTKYDLPVFSKYVLDISEEELLFILETTSEPRFLPWDGRRTVYLYPEKSVKTNVTRYGIFISSRNTLLEALGPLCMNGVVLDRVTDREGKIIYQDPAYTGDEDSNKNGRQVCYRSSAVNDNGMTVYVHKPQLEVSGALMGLSTSLRFVMLAIGAATFCCIVLMALYVYKPVKKAISLIPSEELDLSADNEIGMLYGAFDNQRQQRLQAQDQLRDRNELILERIYKCLLTGRMLTEKENKLLDWKERSYFIISADLLETETEKGFREDVFRKKGVVVVAMPMEQCKVMIWPLGAAAGEDREEALSFLRKATAGQPIRFGVSDVYETQGELRTAYIESVLTLNAGSDKGVFCFSELQNGETPVFYESPQESMTLIGYLRRGDDKAIAQIKSMFERIEKSRDMDDVRLFAEYKALEYVVDVMKRADLPVSETEFARLFRIGSPVSGRDAILQKLADILGQQRSKLESDKRDYGDSMLEYISAMYTDSAFGLDRLAEHFGLTPSAASRGFLEITGSNFKKYLTGLRMEKAEQLLTQTELPVGDIAVQSGFTSASYFIQVFKTNKGVTPAAYRQQHTQNG